MIKSKLLIFSGVFASILLATPALAYDDGYFKGKAIEKANFQDDELVVEPELVYSLPGNRGEGVQAGDADKVVTIIDPKFSIAGISAVFKAPQYTIVDQTKTYRLSSFKRRVGDVLAAGGVDLAKEDKVSPSLDASVSSLENNLINITRVSIAEIEKFESLPYQQKKIDDPTLERGKTKVAQEGQNGKKRLLYSVRRENGVEVSRILSKEEIIEKPKDKIIKVGTKIVVLSSVRGIATATNLSNAVVSANYKKGTLIRITNLANGVTITKTVNYTWGTAKAPDGIVLDLSWNILDELKFNGNGKGPSVLVEEIKP